MLQKPEISASLAQTQTRITPAIFISVLHGAVTVVGSITSRCSGKEPALLPQTHGWTRGLGIVDFNQ